MRGKSPPLNYYKKENKNHKPHFKSKEWQINKYKNTVSDYMIKENKRENDEILNIIKPEDASLSIEDWKEFNNLKRNTENFVPYNRLINERLNIGKFILLNFRNYSIHGRKW